ncbi:hypothetical protein FAZ15_06935 [Sphingobacterium olei]|uniref:Uncharacterized protein n=1 Tax=Sphingobacterium olei TaxID=2571155 RepID=A0A4U0P4H8_9SPHI|nr:DUF6266 family protein [Sphingobacterium olei]TJZ62233.1 hypothetical protein FAZ15_06935 [Sphingobacterium olei]
MAIQKNGPNGAFIGKVGSVFGYVLNGQNIIRGARKPSTKQPSAAELLNREKMKVMANFLGPIYPVLRYGYKELAPKGARVGAVQLAQSHVRKECVELDDQGVPFVNPEKVLVFRGSLEPPRECEMQREGNSLHFRWRVNPVHQDSFYQLNVLIYKVDAALVDLRIALTEASAGQCTIESSVLSTNDNPTHVYVGVVDTYKEILSDSVYLGVVG